MRPFLATVEAGQPAMEGDRTDMSRHRQGRERTPRARSAPARASSSNPPRSMATWGIPALALGIALAGFLSCSPVGEGDVWWHLATGRMILDGGGIPRTDPFTYTAFGRPWVTHEWLSEVLFQALERLGGINLLVILMAGLASLAVALGAIAALVGPRPQERLAGAALGALLAAPAISLRAFIRPHMLTALFLGALLLILRLESVSRRRRWRLALAPLFLLWANLHAGFVLGFALLALYWAGEAVAVRLGGARPTVRPAWRERGLAFLLALGASLINPNHIQAHIYAFNLIARGEVRASIVELRNVFHPAYRGALFLKALAVSGIACALLIFGPRKQLVWSLLLPGLFFAALALASIRGLSEFSVVLPAVLSAHSSLLGNRRRLHQAVCAAVVLLVLAGGTAAFVRGVPVGIDPKRRIGLGVEPGGCPVSAVRLMKEAPRGSRVFNLLSYGGYLIYALGPDQKVYIDGRLDVFPPGFLESYTNMLETGKGWEDAVERYGIDLAVVNYVRNPDRDRGLRARLRQDPNWGCVLAGDYQIVYARRSPENQAILGRYGIPFDPSARSTDFIGSFSSRASPQEIDQATEALANMARLAPEEIAPSLFLAQILDRVGRSREAIVPARRAVRLDPHSVPIRLFLAETLQRTDSLEGARRELERVFTEDPRNVQALSLLALIERSEGHPEDALKTLRKAEALDPLAPDVQLRLGVIEAEAGRLEDAGRHLRRALALRPGDPVVLQNLRALESLEGQKRTGGNSPEPDPTAGSHHTGSPVPAPVRRD